jgi:hypothetical protein
VKSPVETDALNEIRAMYKLVQKKLGIMQDKNLSKTYDKIGENKYSPRYISTLLREKYPGGRVSFYFDKNRDYITLSSDGQLNVRDVDHHLFKSWGISEFKDLKPQDVFQELEKELTRICISPALGIKEYVFSSYQEFITWLE